MNVLLADGLERVNHKLVQILHLLGVHSSGALDQQCGCEEHRIKMPIWRFGDSVETSDSNERHCASSPNDDKMHLVFAPA